MNCSGEINGSDDDIVLLMHILILIHFIEINTKAFTFRANERKKLLSNSGS